LIQVIQELGVDRIAVIAFNRYLNSIVEKEYYQKIKEKLKGKGIFLNIPVRELAAIKKLIHQNKTIWESTDQRLAEVQIVFKEILKRLVYQCSV
ncbi:MAG: ParA family protein, partial [Fusobacterium sp.]